jgi:hypothetical protein
MPRSLMRNPEVTPLSQVARLINRADSPASQSTDWPSFFEQVRRRLGMWVDEPLLFASEQSAPFAALATYFTSLLGAA